MKKQLLLLVMTLLPMVAMAHDIEVVNEQGKTIYYVWTNNNTELAVSCRGEYYSDYSNEYSGEVIIPESVEYNGGIYRVTSISYFAFRACSGLTSVTIPNSVTSIGNDAFKNTGWYDNQPYGILYLDNCLIGYKGRKPTGKLNIEDGTRVIAESAFTECNDITFLFLPNTVTNIGSSAFKDCSGLTSITIPNSVTSLGTYTFYGCKNLTTIDIPNSVTSIGDYAFSGCSGLTSITIPNSVTSIGGSAFYDCSGLTSITIGNSVTSIGDYAFKGCTGLTSVTIPNSVTSIGGSAFYDCSGLTSVTIPNSVTSIGGSAFYDCSGLTSVTIPNSVTSLGTYTFYGCKSLTTIDIPNSVTSIGNYAFYGCSGLTSITIPNSVTSIGYIAFYGCNGLTSVTIPNSVTSIGEGAFYCCSGLTSVTIQCSPTSNSYSIFSGSSNLKEAVFDCEVITSLLRGTTSLESVIINNSVTSIGDRAFLDCSGLTSVTIGNNVTSIGERAFSGCSGLTSVTIPNSVTSIGNYAFYECSGLHSVIIGSGVTSIGSSAFSSHQKTIWLTNTPPSGYSYASGSVNYVSNNQFSSSSSFIVYQYLSSYFEVDGITYVPVKPSERTCDAIDCLYDGTVQNIDVADKVTYKGIALTVKNIQPYTFYGNTNIQSLKMGIAENVGEYAFYGCSNMEKAFVGAISNIEEDKFTGCFIGSNVGKVGNYAFKGCSKLNNLYIADREDNLTFGSCGNQSLFIDCPLEEVYIGGDITYQTTSSYGYSPFYKNTSLKSVTITDKETEISDNEFYGCTNLQNVKIGEGVTTINKYAFSGCQSLKSFAFGSQVMTIGQEAFSDCTAMTRIVSKAVTPPVCGSQALDDISKWTCKLLVPEGTLAAYQAADQWKEFFFTEEGEGSGDDPVIPEDKKCATPTIIYANGKVSFACETENVEFVPSAMLVGSTTYENGEMTLPTTYRISVYAKKDGYLDSDTAIKEVTVTGGLTGDVNQDGKVTITDAVKVVNIILNNGEATAPALQDEEEIKEPE